MEKDNNHAFYNEVKRIINLIDPIGLIRGGAPDDEYEPEINDIIPLIPTAESEGHLAELIQEVFIKWFGAGESKYFDVYKKIAKEIWLIKN